MWTLSACEVFRQHTTTNTQESSYHLRDGRVKHACVHSSDRDTVVTAKKEVTGVIVVATMVSVYEIKRSKSETTIQHNRKISVSIKDDIHTLDTDGE